MMYLDDPTLGVLQLECDNLYVVSSFEIGWPEVREVVNPRALSDGTVDTTQYLGSRAVTVAVRYDTKTMPTQTLIDMVTPYLSPRYRPRLVWSLQNQSTYASCESPTGVDTGINVRSLLVRGANAPVVIDGPKYHTMILQWVAQDPFTQAIDQQCAVAPLTGTGEDGRIYDLSFDRDYPYSPVYGVTYFNTNGNAPMDWTGTLTSTLGDPQILVNNTSINFGGSFFLMPGQTIEFDTRERTILRNGDPNDSVYGLTNFQDWTWDDLRLVPGQNQIRLQAAFSMGDPSFTLCWYDNWYA